MLSLLFTRSHDAVHANLAPPYMIHKSAQSGLLLHLLSCLERADSGGKRSIRHCQLRSFTPVGPNKQKQVRGQDVT